MSAALTRLRSHLPDAVLSEHEQHGDATVVVAKGHLLEVLGFLREEAGLEFDMLSDLAAVDHAQRRDGERTPRFEVVYHLYSIAHNHRLRVKVGVDLDDCEVESAVGIWPAANWMEREVFDLYGIRFSNHPDLRRILLYEEFEGHPLRKDYPKTRRQPLIGPLN
ncbi:MAG: NADH-quinone oxidoreductase subunit C [Myxococcota bacterium]